jgi:hypothetical protein
MGRRSKLSVSQNGSALKTPKIDTITTPKNDSCLNIDLVVP